MPVAIYRTHKAYSIIIYGKPGKFIAQARVLNDSALITSFSYAAILYLPRTRAFHAPHWDPDKEWRTPSTLWGTVARV